MSVRRMIPARLRPRVSIAELALVPAGIWLLVAAVAVAKGNDGAALLAIVMAAACLALSLRGRP